jgi:hypothetical protein
LHHLFLLSSTILGGSSVTSSALATTGFTNLTTSTLVEVAVVVEYFNWLFFWRYSSDFISLSFLDHPLELGLRE